MHIHIEIAEDTLRQLVLEYLGQQLGAITLKAEDISIQVKSKQNYKAEWELAAFRAVVHKIVV